MIARALRFIFRRKKIVIAILVVLAVIGFFVAQSLGKNDDVESATVKRGPIREELILSGEVNAQEKASLGFQIGGQVVYVGAKEGDYIAQYTTLASLDTRTVQKNLQDTLIDYSKQRNTFEQTQDDYQDRKPKDALNESMKRILENNQYDLDKAVVSVELQDLAKQQSFLIAPIAGVVTNDGDLYPGMAAGITTPYFEVVNPDTIYLSLEVDQTELVELSEGMAGTITFDAYPDQEIHGEVVSLAFAPKPEEAETVYEVKVKLDVDNASYMYRIGMTADIVFIAAQRPNALYLPSQFIKSDDKGSYVIAGEKKEKKYITTGIESDENTEIIRGIDEGTVVYDQT